LEVVNPSIIVGQTKTVGAVMLRSRLEGYRSFYGDTEVTSTHPQLSTRDHRAIQDAYLCARGIDQLLPEGRVFLYEGGIAPTIPDVTGYPLIISKAFQPVIEAQQRVLETGRTVMSPLVSAKDGVFME
jgi:hypothetical protein